MKEVVAQILEELRTCELSAHELEQLIRNASKHYKDGSKTIAKKHILPYFLAEREKHSHTWRKWNTNPELENRFIKTLQVKPRRTASGVATITVITKPWPCSGSCIFCPNDIRMPKSYLHNEPACQRAERSFFDPYLQVAHRLETLEAMGHATDKVELIVLGGSFTDYPQDYRIWFMNELFTCLNDDAETRKTTCIERAKSYIKHGLSDNQAELEKLTAPLQRQIDTHEISFNEAFKMLEAQNKARLLVENESRDFIENLETLFEQHRINEQTKHRCVGLVIETRPDALNAKTLGELRALGCTKIQMGIQSLNENILAMNNRAIRVDTITQAFELCRLFGFKTHAHIMANLVGATPKSDKEEYHLFMNDPRFMPDEVKLYPCMLVEGTKLMELYETKRWTPYSEEELIDVLRHDMCETKPFARISRMIRDISACDIVAGNKKTNLRQMVEEGIDEEVQKQVEEIRFRELGVDDVEVGSLRLEDYTYQTSATNEHFLQWLTPEGKIAGFLRLSLPSSEAFERYSDELPIHPNEAMIREVHVYGFAAKIAQEGNSAQHHGLGRKLIERACSIAQRAGYEYINVISAIGTRAYYRKQGFSDQGLYQRRKLN